MEGIYEEKRGGGEGNEKEEIREIEGFEKEDRGDWQR